MPDPSAGADHRRYFEDFHVGQRFTSGPHVMEADEIKAFARQFDPAAVSS
jgi:acyl dehydratase